jgi:ATPase subunit of ABC transporter with duplicated ATPase domains
LLDLSGTIRIGETVQIASISQSRDSLSGDATVYEEIAQGEDSIRMSDDQTIATRAFVAAFNFKKAMQERHVGTLSGGERNRVHLAKAMRRGANLIALDEPSNDLDLDTLRALENALRDFAGSAVCVSHDRWFLNRICTHIIVFNEIADESSLTPDAPSNLVFYNGTLEEYIEAKKDTANLDSPSIVNQVSKKKKKWRMKRQC